MSSLHGKVILVTGASRGIGLAIASALAREGAMVVLVARDPKALARAGAKVSGSLSLAADVTCEADVSRLFREVRKRFGKLDVLINNAGVFTFKPFVRTRLEDWRANLETNLTSLFLSCRAALPLLARSRAPQIVNILSISSRHAFANCSAYTASKFGALGFTRVLAGELRARGVRVTAVLPGPTNTRMVDAFGFPVLREKLIQPEDIGEAVLQAIRQPPRTTVQEIVLTPSRGAL